MSLGCKHDYIIEYNVAKREPVIGAGMGIPFIPRDGGGSRNLEFLKTLHSCRNQYHVWTSLVTLHHAHRLETGIQLRAPPLIPHLEHKKKININLRKKIETSCFVGVFFFI